MKKQCEYCNGEGHVDGEYCEDCAPEQCGGEMSEFCTEFEQKCEYCDGTGVIEWDTEDEATGNCIEHSKPCKHCKEQR